jgi:hypothetical protein
MKITIIKPDSYVYVDGVGYKVNNFYEFPAGIKTLQWDGAKGWLEFENQTLPNEEIDVLPNWTNIFVTQWEEKLNFETQQKKQHDDLTQTIILEQKQAELEKAQYDLIVNGMQQNANN